MPNTISISNQIGSSSAPSYINPSTVSGLVAWYKADVGVYSDAGVTPATNGQTVAQWNDQSGQNNHLSKTTNGPTYNTASKVNGKNTIQFDNSATQALQKFFTLNLPAHLFVVLRQTSWTSGRRIVDGGTSIAFLVYQNGASPEIDLYSGGSGPSSTALAVGATGVVDASYSASAMAIRVNNGTKTTAGTAASNPAGITIGNQAVPTQGANIEIMEYLAYNNVVSDANAIAINRYLGNRWGVTVA